MITNWDHLYMMMSYCLAMKSKDLSTTVGCIIVSPDNEIRTTGYNNFVRGWDDDDIKNIERPYKYDITEHAERNAIYNATRTGTTLIGCRLYVAWHPCCDCARAIVQCGITEIIMHKEYLGNINTRWTATQDTAKSIFKAGGVTTRIWSGKIPEITGLLNGEHIKLSDL